MCIMCNPAFADAFRSCKFPPRRQILRSAAAATDGAFICEAAPSAPALAQEGSLQDVASQFDWKKLPHGHKHRRSQEPADQYALLGCALLLARLARFKLHPARKIVSKRVQLAGTVGKLEFWLNRAGPQILADRVLRQVRPPGDLPDRNMLPKSPTSNDTQQIHVYHSRYPRRSQPGGSSTWVKSQWKLPTLKGPFSVQL